MIKICSVNLCAGTAITKGFCNKHYSKLKKYGTPTAGREIKVKHGMKHSREYKIWDSMKYRCGNKNAVNYKDYGERGITVCKEWLQFDNFFKDMGYSNGLCLDRIDNNKGYYKENCRWASHKQNNRNKRNNYLIQGKTVIEWSEETGLSPQVIHYRINKMGLSDLDAVTTPLLKKHNKEKSCQ